MRVALPRYSPQIGAVGIAALMSIASIGDSAGPIAHLFDLTNVSLVFVRFMDDRTAAVFELRNASNGSIVYSGRGNEIPSYATACLSHQVWRRERWDWCGVGQETQYLGPGQSIQFDVIMCDDHRPTKVELTIGAKGALDRRRLSSEAGFARAMR
jgi:hypothetical protein